MDSEVLYSLFGVIGFSVVIYMTLRAGKTKKVGRSKEDIRLETINKYKISLAKALSGMDLNDESRKAKKIMILREYSEELHFNIFFDENDIKSIISELSGL